MAGVFIVHCKSVKLERSLITLLRIPQANITKWDIIESGVQLLIAQKPLKRPGW